MSWQTDIDKLEKEDKQREKDSRAKAAAIFDSSIEDFEAQSVRSFEDKKKEIRELVGLGMLLDKAYYAAGLSYEEMDELDGDEDFLLSCETAAARVQAIRLHSLERIREANEMRGISTEARWLLEKTDPGRWGTKVSVAGVSSEIPEPEISRKR